MRDWETPSKCGPFLLTMPRIRTIKPEFWADEKMAPLPPIDRLVFLGLISMADDGGRMLDNIRVIDAFIFPETSDSARESIATLSRMRRIRRGITPSGQRVIQIVGWKHQKVDKPNMAAALPEIQTYTDEQVTGIRDGFATDSRENRGELATHINYQRSTTNDLLPLPEQPIAAFGGGEPKRVENPDPKPKRKPVDNWVTQALTVWEEIGVVAPGRMGAALRPVVAKHGVDVTLAALRSYVKNKPWMRRDGSIWGDLPGDSPANQPPRDIRFCSPDDFAKTLSLWLPT